MLSIDIEKLREGVFLATSKDLPGLVVQANSIAETLDIAQDAAQKLLESYREHGDPLPPALRKKIGGSEPAAIKLRRITIPRRFREALGIRAGALLIVSQVGDHLELTPVRTSLCLNAQISASSEL